jgi:GntR family transcriptional repressor for pyruvate dehydrogenase complex
MKKTSDSPFTRVTHAGFKKKSSLIAEQILQFIKTGVYEQASKLPPERIIAEQMKVGRPSVREAISALHIAGILESRPGDGTYVAVSPPIAMGPYAGTVLPARYAPA